MDGAAAGFPDDASENEAAALERWRVTGRRLVAEHAAEFDALLDELDRAIARGRWAEAAARAQVAANHAVFWHTGRFASPRLEAAIHRIGRAAVATAGGAAPTDADGRRRVLHVATEVAAIGGHTRMLRRWIDHDRGNRHDLALTRQWRPLPPEVRESVSATGGVIRRVNDAPGGLLGWARRLQRAIAEAGLVVLHAHTMDIIPFLALAGMSRRPKAVVLNHTDHLFWIGAALCDGVVHTRRSGLELSAARRGVPGARRFLVPLCLEPAARRRSRAEAKQALGLPHESVVILTIARSVKFRTRGFPSLAEIVLPVIAAHPDVRYVAIGAGGHPDWAAASENADGRIIALPERADTGAFLEAADIYLDTCPFASVTSMFEAGLHGVPVVTRGALLEGCDVLAADSPGLDGALIVASDVPETRATLLRLVRDEALRLAAGDNLRSSIEKTNLGDPWRAELKLLYSKIENISYNIDIPSEIINLSADEDIDLLIPMICGNSDSWSDPTLRRLKRLETVLRCGPVIWTLPNLARLLASATTPAAARLGLLRLLVPEWLGQRLRMVRDD